MQVELLCRCALLECSVSRVKDAHVLESGTGSLRLASQWLSDEQVDAQLLLLMPSWRLRPRSRGAWCTCPNAGLSTAL